MVSEGISQLMTEGETAVPIDPSVITVAVARYLAERGIVPQPHIIDKRMLVDFDSSNSPKFFFCFKQRGFSPGGE